MSISRITPPELKMPESVSVFKAEKIQVSNGLSLYVINSGTEDVVKLEIIFPAGCSDQMSYALSSTCHQLIDAGTTKMNAQTIAEEFDYYGAYLQTEPGADFKSISLFSLSRFFPDTLNLLKDVMDDAIFPESEIVNWKSRNMQSLHVNREKVSWLAKNHFNASIFGNNHPYGFIPDEKFIDAVTQEKLQEFHKTTYSLEHAIFILSGKISEKEINAVTTCFGSSKMNSVKQVKLPAPAHSKPEKLHIPKKDSIQSGLRIGKQMLPKNHPDFLKLSVVNTILGGYFGSRLMSNIREDKGYTYGIGSGLVPYPGTGSFFIATEVGNDVRNEAIKEIYVELNRLINDPVPQTELNLVKNYLIGSFQRSLDGPFSLADRFKGLILHNLDYTYFDRYLETLGTIKPEDVAEMAAKHLQPDSMTEIIAG